MIEYTWAITEVERDPETGGIKKIHWRYMGKEGDIFFERFDVLNVQPDPNSSNFVPYENVTKEMVISWLETELADKIPELQQELTTQIETAKNEVVNISGLPWA